MSGLGGKGRRARKRAQRRDRAPSASIDARSSPLAELPDPLVHDRVGAKKAFASVATLAAFAFLAHFIVLSAVAVVGTVAERISKSAEDDQERIEVAVLEPPPPPPPAEPEPEPKDEGQKTAEPEKKPEPKPEPPAVKKPEPKVEPKKTEPETPPPPDPTDRPETPPPPSDQPQPRRIVGLSMESTVGGGSGPAFATGNTRMGSTEKKAANPDDVAPLAKTSEPPPENKIATRLPTTGAKIVPPKKLKSVQPEYPEIYRQQGIEAAVVVRVAIDTNGKPTSVDIVKPAEQPLFNEAAKASVLREEYAPATRGGEPYAYSVTFTVYFRLNE